MKLNFFVKVSLFLSLMLVVVLTSVNAQKTVTGTITDAVSGEGLIGANVVIKNTSNGTTTDFDGNYSLEVTNNEDVLVFSYIGYQDKEVNVGEQAIINIALSSGELLEEVVLIGYGKVKRKDVTGSLKTVSSKDFNRGAVTGPQQLLAGKVAGVNITTDGSPGGGSTIRIRGESSLSASNDPLIVIDGIPLDNKGISGGRNNLNVINPNDIETMTVLKDASATAIYGNRASAGVILITTKKGKISDGLRVGYSAKVSMATSLNKVNVLSADDFRTVITERFGDDSDEVNRLGEASTDWQEEVFQKAFGHDHNLNFSGGVGIVPFRASIGFSDYDGVLKTDHFKRYTGSVNFTPGFLDNKLQLNVGLKYSKSKNHFADKGAIGSAVGFDPTQSIKSDNDDFGGYFAWRDNNKNIIGLSSANPLALLDQKKDESDINRYILNTSIDYRFPFLPALRANLNVGYDFSEASGSIFIDTTAAFNYDAMTGGGTNNVYTQTKKNSLLEFYLNYKEKLFGNDFDVMAGYSYQRYFLGSDFSNSDVRGTETKLKSGVDKAELVMISLFGRVNYNLMDKVFLTATLRQDQTSRFSPENRTGLFPALAASFSIIENKKTYFNSIKARLGWGVTGQQDLGEDYYLYQGLYLRGFENVSYQFGEGYVVTTRPEGYDENIKWETTASYNVGLDFSIVKNKLNATLDVYKNFTKDLLNKDVQVPVGSNLTNRIATNIGDMESEGVEVSLNYVAINKNDLHWDMNANFSINNSTITKLNNDGESIGDEVGDIAGGVGNTIQIHSVGHSPHSYWVYEQSYDDNNQLIPGEFVDRNGDGDVNELDKYRIETSSPDMVFGLSSGVRYKKISFSFAGRAALGRQLYNNLETEIGFLERLNNLAILNNIHQAGIDNNIERQGEATFSDAYIQDADFFRIDHFTLGYDFGDLLGKSFTIYTTIQNPVLFTNYTGLDPEVFHGIDNNTYPKSRTLLFGLNVQF